MNRMKCCVFGQKRQDYSFRLTCPPPMPNPSFLASFLGLKHSVSIPVAFRLSPSSFLSPANSR